MTRSRSGRGYDDDRYGYADERRSRDPRGRDAYDTPRRGGGGRSGGPGPGGGPGGGGGGFQFNVAAPARASRARGCIPRAGTSANTSAALFGLS